MAGTKTPDDFIKGRGAQLNTKNRFLPTDYTYQHLEAVDDWEQTVTKTQFITEQSKTIVNEVKSPDVGMSFSLNPYQGCEHGCIYCYARNTHEYWGYSAGLDFESKIIVKENAPQLLQQFFNHKNWRPATISLSGNTDCYQPIERKRQLTRQLLQVCLAHRNPVSIITKNALILRDLDLLKELAAHNLTQVFISITGIDEPMRLQLEPRTSSYKTRFKILETLATHNIPCAVMNAPIIPGLNDIQMHDVLKTSASAGARWAGYTLVRLNGAVAILFRDWLSKTFPDSADKIIHQINTSHGGQLNDSRFGTRMKGEGKFAEIIRQQFKLYCRKFQLNEEKFSYNTSDFHRVIPGQQSLF